MCLPKKVTALFFKSTPNVIIRKIKILYLSFLSSKDRFTSTEKAQCNSTYNSYKSNFLLDLYLEVFTVSITVVVFNLSYQQ